MTAAPAHGVSSRRGARMEHTDLLRAAVTWLAELQERSQRAADVAAACRKAEREWRTSLTVALAKQLWKELLLVSGLEKLSAVGPVPDPYARPAPLAVQTGSIHCLSAARHWHRWNTAMRPAHPGTSPGYLRRVGRATTGSRKAPGRPTARTRHRPRDDERTPTRRARVRGVRRDRCGGIRSDASSRLRL